MAFNPCVSCSDKFFGNTTYTYLTWWDGEKKFSYRFRQCVACASETRNNAALSADFRNADGEWETAVAQLGATRSTGKAA